MHPNTLSLAIAFAASILVAPSFASPRPGAPVDPKNQDPKVVDSKADASKADVSTFEPPTTQLGEPVRWDAIAEPGFSVADTLRRLLNPAEGFRELTGLEPGGRDPNDTQAMGFGGGTPGVTVQTPVWPIPPGSTGMNVVLDPSYTGIVWNGSAYGEQFGLMLPAGYDPQNPPPLVITWHGFGNSHNQPFFQTLPIEANNRGWMMMSPLGIDSNTYGWLPGQQALEISLEWVRQNYPFNELRVYGVGFSMGASCITNYAARHQQPTDVRFAAVAGVAGSYDNVQVYSSGDATTKSLLQLLFGGGPFVQPWTFEYERTSVQRVPGPVENHSMARALKHIPWYLAWSSDDNFVFYVPISNITLVSYLTSIGNPPVTQVASGLLLKHHWTVLNVPACFDFFASKVLDPNPSNYSVLTDRDVPTNGVTVAGSTHFEFRRVDVLAIGGSGTLSLTNSRQVTTVTVDAASFGFAGNTDVTVSTSDLDGTGDTIFLEHAGNTLPPSRVELDSVANYGWSYDPLAGPRISLAVPAGSHATSVQFNTFDMALGLTGTPTLGSTITFDVTGGIPGDAYGLFYCESPGLFPLSVIGDGDPRWLRLDPLTLNSLNSGTFDLSGEDHPMASVPNDPQLLGKTFPCQAFSIPGSTSGIPFLVGRISNVFDVVVQ